jgi:hypothetical protein
MYFPKFWARSECEGQISWRWSDLGLAEAQALAAEAARSIAERIRNGDIPRRHQGYYPGRPFREQVLRELRSADGEIAAVVTRNSYGCLVLNTARVMFVDVDLPEPKASGGLLKRLFGKWDSTVPDEARNAALAKAEGWTRENPDWGWRIYRTRAGLRLMATHALFDPETAVSNGVFDALSADPLYRQLCKAQKCFRARLTPKPWRCGVYDRPERWPWQTPWAEEKFQAWEGRYRKACRNWATCELVRIVGNRDVHPDVGHVIEFHDEAARAATKLALA